LNPLTLLLKYIGPPNNLRDGVPGNRFLRFTSKQVARIIALDLPLHCKTSQWIKNKVATLNATCFAVAVPLSLTPRKIYWALLFYGTIWI
jgi:hypothetical protein